MILYGTAGAAIQNDFCGTENRSSTLPSNESSLFPNYLYVSPNNILYTKDQDGRTNPFNISCGNTTWPNPMAVESDPELQLVPDVWYNESTLGMIDPRPLPGGLAASSNVDAVPSTTANFFTSMSNLGAFGTSLWLDKWSYLSVNSLLPGGDVVPTTSNQLCGNITSDTTLSASMTYLTCQTFVQSGATLTVSAGATIKAYRKDKLGRAPTLVVEKGGKLEASGTAAKPSPHFLTLRLFSKFSKICL